MKWRQTTYRITDFEALVLRMLKELDENFNKEKMPSIKMDIETIKKEPIKNGEYCHTHIYRHTKEFVSDIVEFV